jgi:Holliday junction resolvase RusA-like endonuclease
MAAGTELASSGTIVSASGWQAVKFTVLGVPQPQGSSRAFIPKGWSRAIITSANPKNKSWRQEVAGAALCEMKEHKPSGRGMPMRVMLAFYFQRPKSVKVLAEKTTKPDIDKLCRSAIDALTGIAFEDDSQVTELFATKAFGNPPRVEITVSEVLPASKAYVRESVKDENLPF